MVVRVRPSVFRCEKRVCSHRLAVHHEMVQMHRFSHLLVGHEQLGHTLRQMQITAMGGDRASDVLCSSCEPHQRSAARNRGRAAQSPREESRSGCRPVSGARPHKKRARMQLDSFPPPATRRLSTAPGLGSVLDQLGQQKAGAGSVRYDDNCRAEIGPSRRPVPLWYSCVNPRSGAVLPQAETRA
jgi:hypothetical protein